MYDGFRIKLTRLQNPGTQYLRIKRASTQNLAKAHQDSAEALEGICQLALI